MNAAKNIAQNVVEKISQNIADIIEIKTGLADGLPKSERKRKNKFNKNQRSSHKMINKGY